MTRAKFHCSQIVNNTDGTTTASFFAVTSGSEENDKFFKYTPSGNLSLSFVNPEVKFEEGKQYYLDISEAE